MSDLDREVAAEFRQVADDVERRAAWFRARADELDPPARPKPTCSCALGTHEPDNPRCAQNQAPTKVAPQ